MPYLTPTPDKILFTSLAQMPTILYCENCKRSGKTMIKIEQKPQNIL